MARKQKLPPVLFTNTPLSDPNTYLFWYEGEDKLPKRKLMPSPDAAIQKIIAAEKAGFAAYASTMVPAYKQHAVFACSYAGKLRGFFDCRNVYASIKEAYDSVTGKQVITQTPAPVKGESVKQVIKPVTAVQAKAKRIVPPIPENDKDDPFGLVVFVWFENQLTNPEPYAYKCRKWHFKGEIVHVIARGERKNVMVERTEYMKRSKMIALAQSKGYDDLVEVELDQGVEGY